MVDLIADRLSGTLPDDERRRRIAEAKGQARPQDLVIVVDCPSWKGETHVREQGTGASAIGAQL
jgi:hypothetical protein